MYIQQGDILLKRSPDFDTQEYEAFPGDLVHKGDNHHHRIRGEFKLFSDTVNMYIQCLSDCELFHEEHNTLTIPAGIYMKGIVLEYDHMLEESREVID